jgi:hypothetical protein
VSDNERTDLLTMTKTLLAAHVKRRDEAQKKSEMYEAIAEEAEETIGILEREVARLTAEVEERNALFRYPALFDTDNEAGASKKSDAIGHPVKGSPEKSKPRKARSRKRRGVVGEAVKRIFLDSSQLLSVKEVAEHMKRRHVPIRPGAKFEDSARDHVKRLFKDGWLVRPELGQGYRAAEKHEAR